MLVRELRAFRRIITLRFCEMGRQFEPANHRLDALAERFDRHRPLLAPLALSAVIAWIVACENPQPPNLCGVIPQQTITVGESASVTACFDDPNGAALRFQDMDFRCRCGGGRRGGRLRDHHGHESGQCAGDDPRRQRLRSQGAAELRRSGAQPHAARGRRDREPGSGGGGLGDGGCLKLLQRTGWAAAHVLGGIGQQRYDPLGRGRDGDGRGGGPKEPGP